MVLCIRRRSSSPRASWRPMELCMCDQLSPPNASPASRYRGCCSCWGRLCAGRPLLRTLRSTSTDQLLCRRDPYLSTPPKGASYLRQRPYQPMQSPSGKFSGSNPVQSIRPLRKGRYSTSNYCSSRKFRVQSSGSHINLPNEFFVYHKPPIQNVEKINFNTSIFTLFINSKS